MCLFFLLYVGMEVCFGLYIATFAVECQLNLSKSEGAFITAIFWGCFAAARFSAIFAAVKLQPIYIMLLSFGFCLVGAFPLAIWAEKSALVLKVFLFFSLYLLKSIVDSGYN
jgi:fucose permease